MRRAATLVLFLLSAGAMLSAQNPANTSGQSTASTNASALAPAAQQNPAPRVDQPATQTTQPATPNNSSSTLASPTLSTAGNVAPGTEMRATLDTPLSTRTSRPGDLFTATVSQPLSGTEGVVVPAGSRVEGEVSEDEQGKDAPSVGGRGKLNLRFRDIVLPNGQTVPLLATLVSVNSTGGRRAHGAENEGQVESGISGRDTATVGVAPGGATFGGPLKGLAVGTFGGGGYVLALSSKQVNLPAETGLVLRLDQGLRVQ